MACNNPFLEDDRFCTRCGEFHPLPGRSKKNVAAQRKAKTLAEKESRIAETIAATPHYRSAKETVQMLSEIYNIEVRVVFRNRLSSYYQLIGNDKHQIVFGYQQLDEYAVEGFSEYASLKYILPFAQKEMVNEKAGILLAIHEFAHALDTKRYGMRRNISHGETYKAIYKELLDLCF